MSTTSPWVREAIARNLRTHPRGVTRADARPSNWYSAVHSDGSRFVAGEAMHAEYESYIADPLDVSDLPFEPEWFGIEDAPHPDDYPEWLDEGGSE